MKEEGRNPSVKTVIGIFMALFYFGLGILLTFTSVFESFFGRNVFSIIVGILFIAYSIFRGYRAIKG
ncbi:hypothetical protein [Prevotella sp. 10(H)]|uniref:hypothetical protein n=1 Tax=Prevotella sp. 10(H) TaxID=1158294 RepID=UPI00069110C8|nr:hypothetical protein [Prevotella sp. 10(H)]